MVIEFGQEAPEFNNERSLGEFKGKNVVLALCPGAFTEVCTTEMLALRN